MNIYTLYVHPQPPFKSPRDLAENPMSPSPLEAAHVGGPRHGGWKGGFWSLRWEAQHCDALGGSKDG